MCFGRFIVCVVCLSSICRQFVSTIYVDNCNKSKAKVCLLFSFFCLQPISNNIENFVSQYLYIFKLNRQSIKCVDNAECELNKLQTIAQIAYNCECTTAIHRLPTIKTPDQHRLSENIWNRSKLAYLRASANLLNPSRTRCLTAICNCCCNSRIDSASTKCFNKTL